MLCYMEPNCVSYNLEKQLSGNDGAHKCELNDATHEENKSKPDCGPKLHLPRSRGKYH